jgi:hypothetical protein
MFVCVHRTTLLSLLYSIFLWSILLVYVVLYSLCHIFFFVLYSICLCCVCVCVCAVDLFSPVMAAIWSHFRIKFATVGLYCVCNALQSCHSGRKEDRPKLYTADFKNKHSEAHAIRRVLESLVATPRFETYSRLT